MMKNVAQGFYTNMKPSERWLLVCKISGKPNTFYGTIWDSFELLLLVIKEAAAKVITFAMLLTLCFGTIF